MKEYIKISIHNHFGNKIGTKSADKLIDEHVDKKIVFDMKQAIEIINDAVRSDFKIIALTNSNNIAASYYYLIKYYAQKRNILVLPGIEVNLKKSDADQYLHVVVVFDPNSTVYEIAEQIQLYQSENRGNFLNLNQLIELAMDFSKCIIAAHGIKQNDKSAAHNPELTSELISLSESYPVVLEDNKEYHKSSLKAKLASILNSDEMLWIDKSRSISCADRSKLSEIESPTYIWGEQSFDDLLYACFMNETRVRRENDIIEKVNYISKITIRKSSQTQISNCEITCSHGLNSIIGASGSGKTLLLNIIKKKLTGKELENKSISKDSNYDSICNIDSVEIFDENGISIDVNSKFIIAEGDNLYKSVLLAYQSNKEDLIKKLDIEPNYANFAQIIDSFNDELNKCIASKIEIEQNSEKIATILKQIDGHYKFLDVNKISKKESIEYSYSSKDKDEYTKLNLNFQDVKKDIKRVKELEVEIIDLYEKYNMQSSIPKIQLHFGELMNTALIRINSIKMDYYYYLINYKVKEKLFSLSQEFNKVMGSQASAVLEKKQEIIQFYSNLVTLMKSNAKTRVCYKVSTLDKNLLEKSITIETNSIAQLQVNSLILEYKYSELSNVFPTSIGNSPKLKHSLFSNLSSYDFTNSGNVEEFIKVFVSNRFKNRVDFSYTINEIIDYQIMLKNNSGNFEDITKISAGDLSKIYINHLFEKRIKSSEGNPIILYDQPDSNMEKTFILEQLVEKFKELRTQYQIFITTHEPLLVVNADSNNIIHVKNNKRINAGNEIEYRNVSFVGVNSKKEMINEVSSLVDGSVNAVKLRSKIYGGMTSEN